MTRMLLVKILRAALYVPVELGSLEMALYRAVVRKLK